VNRYQPIRIIKADSKPIYQTTKYPEVPLSDNDIYVYTTRGDRYDTLALSYYSDPSLWWIISSANPTIIQNSLTPPYGSQIRIPSPSRVAVIIARYENLNRIR
jgi:hypothetical protein